MQDPTHIPPVAALLQRAWEAQPQLGFAEFFARLAARGIARNSSDAELADALRAELSVHPWSFEGVSRRAALDGARAGQRHDAEASPGGATSTITARARIELEPAGANTSKIPERLVTIDPEWIVVRPASTRNPMQPTVWRYEAIQRCRPGEPLRVRSGAPVGHCAAHHGARTRRAGLDSRAGTGERARPTRPQRHDIRAVAGTRRPGIPAALRFRRHSHRRLRAARHDRHSARGATFLFSLGRHPGSRHRRPTGSSVSTQRGGWNGRGGPNGCRQRTTRCHGHFRRDARHRRSPRRRTTDQRTRHHRTLYANITSYIQNAVIRFSSEHKQKNS